jgi:hypothetical protein
MLKLGGVDGDDVRQLAHVIRLVHRETLAGEHFGGGAHVHRKVEDEDGVGAEGLGEVGNLIIEPGNDGRDNNDGGNTDDDAEDGEQGAQTVGAERVCGHAEGFTGSAEVHWGSPAVA